MLSTACFEFHNKGDACVFTALHHTVGSTLQAQTKPEYFDLFHEHVGNGERSSGSTAHLFIPREQKRAELAPVPNGNPILSYQANRTWYIYNKQEKQGPERGGGMGDAKERNDIQKVTESTENLILKIKDG